MTKNERNAFARALENRHTELKNGSRNREALTIETSPDDLDRILHASDRDNAMGHLERTSTRLREVQSALRRVEAGLFGVCAGCEEDINPKRLAAVPWAPLCIVCQEAGESVQTTSRSGIGTVLEMAA
jgi:DnaK suppressor protein